MRGEDAHTADLLGTADLPDEEVDESQGRSGGEDRVPTMEDLALPRDEAGPDPATRDVLLEALDDSEVLGLPPSPLEDRPYSFLPGAQTQSERRRSMRFALAIDTHIIYPDRRREPARVTSGSVDALFVHTRAPLDLDTKLVVELEMLGSHGRRFPAVVVRSTRTGFALQVEPDPGTVGFRAAFVELARQTSLQTPRIAIEIRKSEDGPEAPETADALSEAWARVTETPHDEDVNQAFIHTCMRARQLDFAVDRYRERLASGDGEAERYLEQVGTILGFYNMGPRDDEVWESDGFMTGRVKGWVALILALIVAIGAAQWLTGRRPEPERSKVQDGPGLFQTQWEWGQ